MKTNKLMIRCPVQQEIRLSLARRTSQMYSVHLFSCKLQNGLRVSRKGFTNSQLQ